LKIATDGCHRLASGKALRFGFSTKSVATRSKLPRDLCWQAKEIQKLWPALPRMVGDSNVSDIKELPVIAAVV